MMETLFLSNWQHEQSGNSLYDPAALGGDEIVKRGEMESKRLDDKRNAKDRPYYKRRRVRGGMPVQGGIRPQGSER